MNREQINGVRALAHKGYNQAEIARQLGYSREWVRQICTKHRIKTKRRKPGRDRFIKANWGEMTVGEIAKALDIPKRSVVVRAYHLRLIDLTPTERQLLGAYRRTERKLPDLELVEE